MNNLLLLILNLFVRLMMACLWRHYWLYDVFERPGSIYGSEYFYEIYCGWWNYWPRLNITAALEQKLGWGAKKPPLCFWSPKSPCQVGLIWWLKFSLLSIRNSEKVNWQNRFNFFLSYSNFCVNVIRATFVKKSFLKLVRIYYHFVIVKSINCCFTFLFQNWNLFFHYLNWIWTLCF